MSQRRLDELGARIENLVLAPESISAPLTRLLRPFYYRMRWRPSTSIEACRRLADALAAAPRPAPADLLDELWSHQADALDELEENLEQIERATVINRRPLISHADWLRRLYEITVRSRRALETLADTHAVASFTRRDPASLLPPLTLSGAHTIQEAIEATQEGDDSDGGIDPTRVLELQLDAVDHIMAAARASGEVLARRRRLFEAARQLLLETSAALPLDPAGVEPRLASIANQITSINRMQAVGLRADVTLLHQARTALSRGERTRLFVALQALHRASHERNDAEKADLTRRALDAMQGDGSREPPLREAELSARSLFGNRIVQAVQAGYQRARDKSFRQHSDGSVIAVVSDVVRAYFAPGEERATLASALTVDGCFDVGGVLTPVRVEEEYIERTRVPFPTQELNLVPAVDANDIPAAVIGDPRAILLDLAAGRLLTRTFVREDIATRSRTEMQGEVRVYVLDGSGSMLGPRARMRDAILVAELATLIRRLEDPNRNTRITLYFRYFNHELGPVTRVSSADEALEAIRELLSEARSGGTDIEGALLASLARVQKSAEEDPDLAKAQIVLITDGEAPVRMEKVDAARSAIGNRPVGISVIALGEQNHQLRMLVARQRRLGERAFYHFLPDAYLERVSSGDVDDGTRVHVPSVPGHDDSTLDAQIAPILDDLAALERTRERDAVRRLHDSSLTRRLHEDDESSLEGEGERARLEAHFQDDDAIARRFERWYPRPDHTPGPTQSPEPGTREHADLESLRVLCAAVVEVLEIVGRTPRDRRADAVELLERLLPNSRLTPARFHELLRLYPAQLASSLEAVHAATREGVYWRMKVPLGSQP